MYRAKNQCLVRPLMRNLPQLTKFIQGHFNRRIVSSRLPLSVINSWRMKLKDEGIQDADESVKWIANHLSRSKCDDEKKIIRQFNDLCKRRLNREPVQYIIGEWDFRDITLQLRRPVFIPRPETEGLVDLVNHTLNADVETNIFEIGCGSGAISLALAKENKSVFCTAIDVSEKAVNLARENCLRLDLCSRVAIMHNSLEEYTKLYIKNQKFDIIVSNPPYIPTKDMKVLQPEISKYEDHQALHGGNTGLDFVLEILSVSQILTSKHGHIWLEVDTTHPPIIKQVIEDKFRDTISFIETFNDIYERPRFCHLMTLK